MSFRKYGGLTYNSTHNMVNSLYNNTSILTISNGIGLNNSYINVYSDLDNDTREIYNKKSKGINFSKDNDTINIEYDWKTKFFINGGSNNENMDYSILKPDEVNIDKIYPVTYNDSQFQKRIGLLTSENLLKDPNEYDFNKIDILGLLGVLVKEIQSLKSFKFADSQINKKEQQNEEVNVIDIKTIQPIWDEIESLKKGISTLLDNHQDKNDNIQLSSITCPNYKYNSSFLPLQDKKKFNINKVIPVQYIDELGSEKIGIMSTEKILQPDNNKDNIDLIGLIGILTSEIQELKKRIEILSKN